jgi:amino acid transporter
MRFQQQPKSKDPQRDLPRGMMWAIIICTILYVVIALVLLEW